MNIEENKLNIYISSNVDQCIVKDIITYTIEIKNISSCVVENVIIRDLLHSDLSFIKKSVSINFIEDIDSNIISGLCLGDINIGETYIVTFDAQVISLNNKTIDNEITVEYECCDNNSCHRYYITSNKCKIIVKNPMINIVKMIDKESFFLNDIIEYTLLVTNNGDLDLFNIFLVDNLPRPLEVEEGSFYIDNILVNSVEVQKGVSLDSLLVGKTKTVKYKVKLKSVDFNKKIPSSTVFKYSYMLPNGCIGCNSKEIKSEYINTHISNFKQISMDKYLWLPEKNPDLKEINNIKAKANIIKYEIVKTSNATSCEGQVLSGYKLIIHGNIEQTIEYTSCEHPQGVHCVKYTDLFSTYIILPENFSIKSKINIEATIEDVYFTTIDDRCFFKSIMLLLFAKVIYC